MALADNKPNPPILSPDADRAYAVIRRALSRDIEFCGPVLSDRLDALSPWTLSDVLIALEEAFDIELDADEAFGCVTFLGLICIVELKTTRAVRVADRVVAEATPTSLYDFGAHRAAIGRAAPAASDTRIS